MAFYQASKQITKFIISGLLAVMVDFLVYFAVSQYLEINLSKGISFCSGMLVTYNMNKYWTWRQTDTNNRRLVLFTGLYLIAMAINIVVNHYSLELLPDGEFFSSIRDNTGKITNLITIKIDKVAAFVIATGTSAAFTFVGQKFWLFKEKDQS